MEIAIPLAPLLQAEVLSGPAGWACLTVTLVAIGISGVLAASHGSNKRPSNWDKHTKPRAGRPDTKNRKNPKWKPNPSKNNDEHEYFCACICVHEPSDFMKNLDILHTTFLARAYEFWSGGDQLDMKLVGYLNPQFPVIRFVHARCGEAHGSDPRSAQDRFLPSFMPLSRPSLFLNSLVQPAGYTPD
eukprot:gene495-268_t